uniref:Harmonin-like n=1 Tax=Saccoglossus kowalevskii TaxID=10224 RepID=A0ABM0MGN9_SACKO|nr:PREDICTED: harmonin-like [Saccoglossus kowalevskii]
MAEIQKVAKSLDKEVQMLVDDDNERELLYRALKSYKQIMSVERLVSDLKKVLNTPKRMILERLRVIRLVKQGQKKESFGFSVRGGVEHGVGIFVSEVVADSQASNKGLKVGDQLVRVNGFNISQATHDEVLALVNSKRIVTLKVKTVGMIPIKNNKNDPVTWKYIENASILYASSPGRDEIYIQYVKAGSLAEKIGIKFETYTALTRNIFAQE